MRTEIADENKAITGTGKTKISKKKVRRIIVLAVCAVAVMVGVYSVWSAGRGGSRGVSVSPDDTTVLSYTDVSNAISATGTVESGSAHTVYSSLNHTVKEVFVEVGDRVSPETLLCKLDSSSLEDQIASKELATNLSAKSAAQQVKTARDSYNAAKSALDKNQNASLINAESSRQNAYDNWTKAKTTYEEYRSTLDSGLNASLISQDSSLRSATDALAAAQKAYDTAVRELAKATSERNNPSIDTFAVQQELNNAQSAYNKAVSTLQGKQAALDSAYVAYQNAQAVYAQIPSPGESDMQALTAAQTAYTGAVTALEAAQTELHASQDKLSAAQKKYDDYVDDARETLDKNHESKTTALENAATSLNTAQYNYDAAIRSRDAAYRSADSTLADYARAIDTAYASYQSAQASYDAAVASAQSSLQSSKDSLQSAQINAINDSAVLELAQLQEDLEATQIYAGVEGTVTAVYATVGSSGSGLLFVVEDTDDLIVKTSVKEYDIDAVAAGMPVTIKSDATGSAAYEGTVLSIAPTSNKKADGTTDTSGDVLFAAKVRVTSLDTKLRIGMSVRLNYIVEQREHVFSVPYDAVYTNAAGDTCVLILEGQPSGSYVVREAAVEQLMENDIAIAIEGAMLSEGVTVINEPGGYRSLIGSEITVAQQGIAPGLAG